MHCLHFVILHLFIHELGMDGCDPEFGAVTVVASCSVTENANVNERSKTALTALPDTAKWIYKVKYMGLKRQFISSNGQTY